MKARSLIRLHRIMDSFLIVVSIACTYNIAVDFLKLF